MNKTSNMTTSKHLIWVFDSFWGPWMLFTDRYTTWCANTSETGQAVPGRTRDSNYANAQSRPSRKPDSTEWTFILIQCSNKNILSQQLSVRRAGNSHPPAGFIQRLDSFSLRLDWHLLASIMGLKEGLEQRWQETEKKESLHNQKTVKDVTWLQIT